MWIPEPGTCAGAIFEADLRAASDGRHKPVRRNFSNGPDPTRDVEDAGLIKCEADSRSKTRRGAVTIRRPRESRAAGECRDKAVRGNFPDRVPVGYVDVSLGVHRDVARTVEAGSVARSING